jgi:hypothetical protein
MAFPRRRKVNDPGHSGPSSLRDGDVRADMLAQQMKATLTMQRNMAERRALLPKVIAGATEAKQLLGIVRNRHFEIVFLHLSGFTRRDIAKVVLLKDLTVKGILQRPEIVKLIALVREAQLAQVIRGEYGVREQAKAAAPKVLENLINKAGGGTPATRAEKDRDQIKAAETVLKVSKDLGAAPEATAVRSATYVDALFAKMTPAEITTYKETGQFPASMQAVVMRLGIRQGRAPREAPEST